MKEEEILRILNSNPHFINFYKEFQGKFILYYNVKGVDIYFYNCVGGIVDAWLNFPYDLYNDNGQIRDFIDVSRKIIQQKVNSIDAYKPL